ncbi:substrate-binding domain-containing protein [Methylomarinum vadi]|uniref:substrate-binding domain-containing protein n=1 Tax=Methylomarinum vadi TaxID=438855 RepID=UPI0004DF2EEC|nr:substrate-binding domain-containing protein [Methylomarinum vadi]
MNSSSKGIILLIIFLLQDLCHAMDFEHAPGKVVPVVNHAITQDAISKQGLSAIFKMRLHRWQDGTPITVFVLSDDNPLHKAFCKEILNVFPHQMRRIWNRLVFSGSGQAPIELNSNEEMISRLISTPGAIGYLRSDQIEQGLKELRIQAGGKD